MAEDTPQPAIESTPNQILWETSEQILETISEASQLPLREFRALISAAQPNRDTVGFLPNMTLLGNFDERKTSDKDNPTEKLQTDQQSQATLGDFRTLLTSAQIVTATALLSGILLSKPNGTPETKDKPDTTEKNHTRLDRTTEHTVQKADPFAKYAVGDYRLVTGQTSLPLDKATVTLGRDDGTDIQLNDEFSSRRHAQIEFKNGQTVIRDLGSSNGTFVNGKQLKVGTDLALVPGDKIKIGEVEFTFGIKPEYHFAVNGRPIDLRPGDTLIGRNPENDLVLTDEGISRRHAKISNTANGPVITDLGSTNGTYVNGQKIKANDPVLLKPGDTVRFGAEGAEYKLGKGTNVPAEVEAPRPADRRERREVKEYKVKTGESDPAANADSVDQSNKYKKNGEMRDRIRDGFQTLSGDALINRDGTWNDPNRPGTIVDRTRDHVLNDTIAEAHRRFDHLKGDKKALARELARFSKEKLHPSGWTEDMVDASYDTFRSENKGRRILLGDYIERASRREGAGVCQHQALLMKVLGDAFGLDVSLVHGYYGEKPKGGLPRDTFANHAWNEVYIDGTRYVYDPRQEQWGKTPRELPRHNPARDWLGTPAQEAPAPRVDIELRAGDRVNHDGLRNWLVTTDKPKAAGKVVLSQSCTRDCAVEEITRLNDNRKLVVGDRYKVRRTDGSIEDGWRLMGRTPDGELKFYKADGIKKEVSLKDLARENPNLDEIRAAREPEPPAKLSKEVERGLKMAEELRGRMSDLKLQSKEQVTQLLKSTLEEIDALPQSKRWSEADRNSFEKFISAYERGDAPAVSSVNKNLRVDIPSSASDTRRTEGTRSHENEQTSLAELRRQMLKPEERAKAVAELIETGHLRRTLEDAGIKEERARSLERRLLSNDKAERDKARAEIDLHFRSKGKGGIGGFAKEFRGRAGALVLVAAAILPFLIPDNDASRGGDSSATWSGGKR